MSIFGTMMSKIFHHDEAAAAPAPNTTTTASAAPAPADPGDQPSSPHPAAGAAPENAARPSSPTSSGAATPGSETSSSPTAAPGGQSVDVAAVLDGLAAKNGQGLDWKHSIVDMMKLLGLDSGLSSRQELAKELDYSGDMHDSATMNVWLHKQVMQKLAANGGKVPDSLRV